jgi:hypothetical protein
MRKLWLALALLAAASAHAQFLVRGGGQGGSSGPPVGNPSAAATWTAQHNALCKQALLGDYYAEIDNASSTVHTAPLWSYQVGTTMTPTTLMAVASASKFVAEMVAATRDGPYTSYPAGEIAQLHMLDGSNNQADSCPNNTYSIATCLQTANTKCIVPRTGVTINGYTITSTESGAVCNRQVGLFNYGGAHFDINALTYGPSAQYAATVANLGIYMGTELGMTGIYYSTANIAGDADMTPITYLTLLQNVINGSLPNVYNALGQYTVVTNYAGNTGNQGQTEPPGGIAGNYIGQTIWNPELGTPAFVTVTSSTTIGSAGPNGPWIQNGISQASGSPIPENWLYSMIGWEETDPASHGDGAFSSAGSYGFYPWISHDKTLVGVLARSVPPGGVGFQSAQCGRLLRRAWTSGIGQSGTYPTP